MRVARWRAILGLAMGLGALLCVTTGTLRGGDEPGVRTLDGGVHHLGRRETPDWKEAAAKPEGWRLDIDFEAKANAREVTLEVSQRNVLGRWSFALNGAEVGVLRVDDARRTYRYPLPAGTLRDGTNRLTFLPGRAMEDVTLGLVRLHDRPIRDLLALGRVAVRVRDAGPSGAPIPARLTVADDRGKLAPVYLEGPTRTAVRRGVLYAAGGEATFELPEGRYDLTATRGGEWGLGRRAIVVTAGACIVLDLPLAREVDTRGFIAADTHIHTYSFGDHGDASVEERMATLAGEGVELAVATDHNHATDYRPFQRALGLAGAFTAVTGDEVTTKLGHFNAFPLEPGAKVPGWKDADWGKLVDGMRERGAAVVVLNHPRWPSPAKGPFGVMGLDRESGARTSGPARLGVDAMEVLNSNCPLDDPLDLFRDWFAVLRSGESIAALGTSDSHTVDEAVGQGRTYVPSATDDPGAIDVADACRRIRRGETSVAFGIYVEAAIGGVRPGGVVAAKGVTLTVDLRVAAPSWIRPRRALVFVDGNEAASREVETAPGAATDRRLSVTLPADAKTDGYVVCVVVGDGVEGPHWRTRKPYTLGATNPIWLDRDGDGKHGLRRE